MLECVYECIRFSLKTPIMLSINKPAGLIVHADGKTNEPTVVDWLFERYPEIKEVGEPWTNPRGETIYRPGIVPTGLIEKQPEC
jgi:hypothetical protein